MRSEGAACLLVLALAATPAAAQWRDWEAEFDEEKKSWKEMQAQIPPYPVSGNLVRLEGGTSGHQFFVDTTSISVGEDGIVRYAVFVRTAGGATNVTFEGMRCETREQKVYAIGRSDRSWVRARNAKWRRVVLRELTPHHHTLYHQYFCVSRTQPTPPKVAIDALKRGQGLNRDATSGD